MRRWRIVFGLLGTICLSSGNLFAGGFGDTEFRELFGELLNRYRLPKEQVNGIETSVFDFKRMSRDARLPDSLFQRALIAFEETDVSELRTPAELKAFWMNAYNFAAMKLVVDYYPLKSIRDRKISLFKYPWSKKVLRSGGKRLTLKGIEQTRLLEQFQDPRIVFAVNCMTISCPDIAPEPFEGNQLDAQLDQLMRVFLANKTKGFWVEHSSLTVHASWIFSKHKDLIDQEMGGLEGVIHRYLDPETCTWMEQNGKSSKVRYLDHDWTLNDSALGEMTQSKLTR